MHVKGTLMQQIYRYLCLLIKILNASHRLHPVTFGKGNEFLIKFLNFIPSAFLKT